MHNQRLTCTCDTAHCFFKLCAHKGVPLKRVTVVFPSDLHRDLKLMAVHDDRTMNDLILTAVRKYMQECGADLETNDTK